MFKYTIEQGYIYRFTSPNGKEEMRINHDQKDWSEYLLLYEGNNAETPPEVNWFALIGKAIHENQVDSLRLLKYIPVEAIVNLRSRIPTWKYQGWLTTHLTFTGRTDLQNTEAMNYAIWARLGYITQEFIDKMKPGKEELRTIFENLGLYKVAPMFKIEIDKETLDYLLAPADGDIELYERYDWMLLTRTGRLTKKALIDCYEKGNGRSRGYFCNFLCWETEQGLDYPELRNSIMWLKIYLISSKKVSDRLNLFRLTKKFSFKELEILVNDPSSTVRDQVLGLKGLPPRLLENLIIKGGGNSRRILVSQLKWRLDEASPELLAKVARILWNNYDKNKE